MQTQNTQQINNNKNDPLHNETIRLTISGYVNFFMRVLLNMTGSKDRTASNARISTDVQDM